MTVILCVYRQYCLPLLYVLWLLGLAEVEGIVVPGGKLIAPIGDTECIAYEYEIEDIDHDSEGRTSYTTVHSENKCNAFSIQDETGILDVTPEKLNLLCLPINKRYQKEGKRYTQRLLLPGDKVLLIGMADTRGGKTVFRYEETKKVYTLMPSQHSTNTTGQSRLSIV